MSTPTTIRLDVFADSDQILALLPETSQRRVPRFRGQYGPDRYVRHVSFPRRSLKYRPDGTSYADTWPRRA